MFFTKKRHFLNAKNYVHRSESFLWQFPIILSVFEVVFVCKFVCSTEFEKFDMPVLKHVQERSQQVQSANMHSFGISHVFITPLACSNARRLIFSLSV